MLSASYETALDRFAKAVIKQARANLTRGGHKHTGDLYKSLDNYKIKVSNNSVELAFYMEEYGEYQDLGVKGAANFKSHKMKRYTPYRFRDKIPPPNELKDWANSKGLNEFAVSRSIYQKGIPQTLFFTKPFERQFPKLPEPLIDLFVRDVEEAIRFALQRKR